MYIVIVCDDHELWVMDVMLTALREAGHRVGFFGNTRELLEWDFRRELIPDVIIMDAESNERDPSVPDNVLRRCLKRFYPDVKVITKSLKIFVGNYFDCRFLKTDWAKEFDELMALT